MIVPVEEAEDADEESSSNVCSGRSATWLLLSSARSSSSSSNGSIGTPLSRLRAHAFCRSLIVIPAVAVECARPCVSAHLWPSSEVVSHFAVVT